MLSSADISDTVYFKVNLYLNGKRFYNAFSHAQFRFSVLSFVFEVKNKQTNNKQTKKLRMRKSDKNALRSSMNSALYAVFIMLSSVDIKDIIIMLPLISTEDVIITISSVDIKDVIIMKSSVEIKNIIIMLFLISTEDVIIMLPSVDIKDANIILPLYHI